MTAITFPNSPSSGDTHTAGNGIVYTYDGEKWTSIGTNSAGTWTRSGTEVSLTNAGDDLNVDSGTLFVDASTDRVGIGTTSPVSQLDVSGTTTPTVTLTSTSIGGFCDLNFADPSDADVGQIRYEHSSNYMAFNTNANERVRIDSSGRLLVGQSSSPSIGAGQYAKLFVAGYAGGSPGGAIVSIARDEAANAMSSGDTLGELTFTDNAGGAFASVRGAVDAAPGTSDFPGRLAFLTTADGASSPTERMRINNLGDVGVGTTVPTYYGGNFRTLEVAGSAGNDGGIFSTVTADNVVKAYFYTESTSDTATIGTVTNHPLLFRTNSVERMRLDTSGRVGIQNSSPGSMHPGADDLVIGAATGDIGITLASLTNGAGNIFFVDSAAPSGTNAYTGYVQYDHGANNLNFGTLSNLRMRIDSNGTVKSSTSTSLSTRFSGNIYHLSHNHNNGNTVHIFEHSGGTTPYGIYIQFSQNAPDNNTQYFISCEDTTTHRFYVYSDGDVVNHDNSYGAISDVKLKQDIVDSGSQWDDLKNLRVRKFKFKSDVEAYGNEAKTLIGLVAQEAELVSPGLVKENPDTDSDNNDLGTTTKSVNYSVLYMKAIKALQEAMERIETLEQRLTDAGIA